MNDLISRQAVFDVLNSIYSDWQTQEACKALEESIIRIEELPSAQPERRWIPVSERLPEKGGRYLCTVGAAYRNPREMIYAPQEWSGKSDSATWKDPSGHYVFDWFVEAWQVLPEPYREGEDGSNH